MLKKLGIILLALSISTLLSSCLVSQKDVETSDSTDNFLRIYKPSDTINYRVQIHSSNDTEFGTLQIKWSANAEISNPLTLETYSVLKETTTLTIDNETPNELIRYIEQDSSDNPDSHGSIYLRAFDTAVTNEYYWLSDQLNAGTLERFETFHSPLPLSLPQPNKIDMSDFYILGDCTGTDCPTRAAFVSSRTFNVTARNQEVETLAATFTNAYKVQYNVTTNRETTTPLLDILAVCGGSGITTYAATLYIVPEIGIVRMENTCNDLSSAGTPPVTYIITLDNTSIPLP